MNKIDVSAHWPTLSATSHEEIYLHHNYDPYPCQSNMVEKGDEYPPHQRIILITSAQSLGTELLGLTDIGYMT